MLIFFQSMTSQLHYAIFLLQYSRLDVNGTQADEKHHSFSQVNTKYQDFEFRFYLVWCYRCILTVLNQSICLTYWIIKKMIFFICLSFLVQTETHIVLNKWSQHPVRDSHDSGLLLQYFYSMNHRIQWSHLSLLQGIYCNGDGRTWWFTGIYQITRCYTWQKSCYYVHWSC